MKNRVLKDEMNKIIDFASSCRHVYIYGAGNFGRGYLDILQYQGKDANGFIVTEKHGSEYMKKPIYSVDEISSLISTEDGIIPAFTDSSIQEIERRFENIHPRILEFDHKMMLCLENELYFSPLIDKLDQEFPDLKKEIDKSEWKKILIVRLDAIGDTVFTTPFIRELRKNFPESYISVVIRKQNKKLLENCPYIDELFLYESELLDGELADQCKSYPEFSIKIREFTDRNFKNKKFDVVFFPRELLCGRNTIEELLIAYYSRAKYRIGRILTNEPDKQFICERLRKSFTLISNPSEPMHEAAYMLDMLKKCSCTIEDERMELWTSPQSEKRIFRIFEEEHIKDHHILIALGVVASVETRTWKINNYNQLVRHYGEQFGNKIKFVVMGGDDAKKAAGQMDNTYENIINLAGRTDLNETAACMEKCNLYVGSNTGLLHFASAYGIPSITIYSELSDGKPTDGDSPFRMGAWKAPHIDLVPPAGLDGCHGVCRMGFSHCINQIVPMQVVEAINETLDEELSNILI